MACTTQSDIYMRQGQVKNIHTMIYNTLTTLYTMVYTKKEVYTMVYIIKTNGATTGPGSRRVVYTMVYTVVYTVFFGIYYGIYL